MKAEVYFSCGRGYLEVNGVVVSLQGDPCRDPEIEWVSDCPQYYEGRPEVEEIDRQYKQWTVPMLRAAAAKINKPWWRFW